MVKPFVKNGLKTTVAGSCTIMKLLFRLPVSINDDKYTWNINIDDLTHNFECSLEKTDTQMILHAALSSTDDLLLPPVQMFWFWSFMCIQSSWFNEDGFLNTRMTNVLIEIICSCLGKLYALALLIYFFILTFREVYLWNIFLKRGLFRVNCLCAWQFLFEIWILL